MPSEQNKREETAMKKRIAALAILAALVCSLAFGAVDWPLRLQRFDAAAEQD